MQDDADVQATSKAAQRAGNMPLKTLMAGRSESAPPSSLPTFYGALPMRLQRAQEVGEVLFLLSGQADLEPVVVVFHDILQRCRRTVSEVGLMGGQATEAGNRTDADVL